MWDAQIDDLKKQCVEATDDGEVEAVEDALQGAATTLQDSSTWADMIPASLSEGGLILCSAGACVYLPAAKNTCSPAFVEQALRKEPSFRTCLRTWPV